MIDTQYSIVFSPRHWNGEWLVDMGPLLTTYQVGWTDPNETQDMNIFLYFPLFFPHIWKFWDICNYSSDRSTEIKNRTVTKKHPSLFGSYIINRQQIMPTRTQITVTTPTRSIERSHRTWKTVPKEWKLPAYSSQVTYRSSNLFHTNSGSATWPSLLIPLQCSRATTLISGYNSGVVSNYLKARGCERGKLCTWFQGRRNGHSILK